MELKNEQKNEECVPIEYDTQIVEELRVKLEDDIKLVIELVHFLDTGKDLFAKYGLVTVNKDDGVSLSFSSKILSEIEQLDSKKYDLDKFIYQAFIKHEVNTLTFDIINVPEAIKSALLQTIFKYLDTYSSDNKSL